MFTETNIDPIAAMGIGHPITKKEMKEFVKKQLATNKAWAIKALLKIFEKQTEYEREAGYTREYNKVGFTGIDGEILTSFAKHYQDRGFLSPKQMNIVYKKMPKYWMQIIKISDQKKLELQIRLSLVS
jgi:cyclopropane fatty-acyl-phospholipid synthase-like methyltransferase